MGPRGESPAIEVRELVMRYGSRVAVAGISLEASRGEVLCILGPNGAGKTSTVECMEGYRRAASGTVRVLGMDPARDHAALTPRMGVMLQRGGVYPMLGPRRVLRLFASFYEQPRDPEELMELVALKEVAKTPWRHLSGGEQARVSLALALVGRPEVVFLDEPTAGVDPEGRLAVREVVRALRDGGTCVVLTTHELAEAERVADRVVVLREGALVVEGPPGALRRTEKEITFSLPGTGQLDCAALGASLGARVEEIQPGRYRVVPEGTSPAVPPADLAAALTSSLARAGLTLSELRIGQSLEEAYLSLLAQGGQP